MQFDGSTSCDPDGDALTYTWSFDDGGSASGSAPSHVFASPGAHAATLTVTDPGADSGSVVLAFDVAGAPADAPAPGAGGPTSDSLDTTAPVLTGLRAAPASFAVRSAARAGAKAKGGTTLGFTLSEAANVTIALQREVAGHRSGARCVAGTPARGSRAKPCTEDCVGRDAAPQGRPRPLSQSTHGR